MTIEPMTIEPMTIEPMTIEEVSEDIINIEDCWNDFEIIENESKMMDKFCEISLSKKQNGKKGCECDLKYQVHDNVNGSIVCTNCGIVAEEYIMDNSAEWNFGPDDAMFGKDPARCGCPVNPLLEKSSMSTIIGPSKGNKNWFMKRLHMQLSMDYVERSRYHVFEKINKMGTKGNLLPMVIETAKAFYKKISETKLSRGNIRLGLIACCLMHSCKHHKCPRSSREISEMCEIDISTLNQSVKIFYSIIPDTVPESHTDTNDLVVRFCNMLNIDKQLEKQVVKDVRKNFIVIEEDGSLLGRTPNAITSALIYISLHNFGYNVNKNLLSKSLNISMVTLNKLIIKIQSII